MNEEDVGRKLLAAVEALHGELREMRKEVREDRVVREALDTRRRNDADRQARLRAQNRHVTSRDNHVTLGSLKALDLGPVEQKQELKIQNSRDNHVIRHVTETAPTWDAYGLAYEGKYKAKPVRNKTVNSQMKRFVERVGVEEAPMVAAWYVGHVGAWYAQKMHPVGLLLADAEKLRTEWATGRQITSTEARLRERTETNLRGWEKLLVPEERDASGKP